ncbi:hypothetical protein D3C86_340620 [compost metagenome]
MENILDDSWVKSAFLLPSDQIMGGNQAAINRIYSTSMQKATDTTLGGNFVINPLPQFTRYCDLKHNILTKPTGRGKDTLLPKVSRTNGTSANSTNGMGRVYSEKFDDNMQVVHFRCGYPQFNSLTSFYANYYSIPAASMARSGRAPGFFYSLGWAVGSVATIGLLPFIMAGKAIKFFLRRPASKYYYLKPSMLPYWGAVSSMVNGIAANMGIIPRPIYEGAKALYEKENGMDQLDVDAYHKLIPSIYRANGGIDVFAVAQRGQKLVNHRRQLLDKQLNKITNKAEMREVFKKRLYGEDMGDVYAIVNKIDTSYEAYVDIWKNSEMMGQISEADTKNEAVVEKTGRMDEGLWARTKSAFKSESQMASEFISFRVDHTGTQTESFSNGTKEPSIQGQINGISASARETRFSMFDGNIEGTGIVAGALGAVKDFALGVGQGIGIQGLAQLAGSAYVDIPKVWDSSSAEFNKLSLNIPLRSPYGDPLSRLQNLILPMCCLFAMSVPLSTGKQSHTSPFLIEYFAQGRAHSRLAIVDSLTITRGVGDVGWNNTGGFLGVDIQLGLLDLSTAVNMPLNPAFEISDRIVQAAGYGVGAGISWLGGGTANTGGENGVAVASAMLGSTYDDDNNYTDYLAILAGIPLEAEINTLRKWAMRLARQQAAFDDAHSPERGAMWAMSGVVGEVAKAFALATDRQ